MWAIVGRVLLSIPVIAQAILKTIEAYENYQKKKIEKHYETKAKVRLELIEAIKKEEDDEKLKELHRRLSTLDSNR